ncbi:DUF4424 family protein [Bdellovibrio sp. HCB337]|uniref:DUF4424 family protein n=1 Tax=Bdellovibrio sp. HCB337 TaxID=3394358 RepID=UPI0039A6029F
MKSLILFVSLAFGSISLANDGYSAIGAGGIVFNKSSSIDMKNEVLTISENNVNVKYEFIHRPGAAAVKKTEKALIAFPMPEMTCGYWGKAKMPDDFSVLVDGKKVNFKKEVKALKGEEDVTEQVKKAGLPVDCRELDQNKELFKKAQKAKWAEDFQGADPEDVLYSTQVTYYWEQEFPADKIVNIEHSYTPVLGVDSGHPSWFFNLAPHWDRNPNVKWTTRVNGKDFEYPSSDVLGGKSLNYVLTTAKTWSMGGVTNFKLIIKRKTPETFVGSSLGPLVAVDKNTFEYRAVNYAPDRDLTIFFGKSK